MLVYNKSDSLPICVSNVYDISQLNSLNLPDFVLWVVYFHIYKDNSKLFPCDCDCYLKDIKVSLCPLNCESDLAFSFKYSLEDESWFCFDDLKDYYIKISHYSQLQISISVDQDCKSLTVEDFMWSRHKH